MMPLDVRGSKQATGRLAGVDIPRPAVGLTCRYRYGKNDVAARA
jgi:hypothetical protein